MTKTNPQKPLVLVTGSAGLIGSRILRELHDAYRLVGLDVNVPDELPAGVESLECDLTSDQSVERALGAIRGQHGAQIASVVHLAAYYDFSGEPSPMYDKLTVKGTERLVNRLKTVARVEQLIFSSSLLVMKPAEEESERLTEQSPTQTAWDYPRSKLQAERVLRNQRGDIPVVILRLAGVYDEGCHSLPLGQQIRRIYEKHFESFVFPGDADHGQPFIHLDDVAACIRRMIERRSDLGPMETFLVAEPEVMSYRELQDALGMLIHGKEWPTIRIPKVVAKAGAAVKEKLGTQEEFIKPWMIDLADDHYPVDIRRICDVVDWEPRHRLRDTLPAMIDALKADPYKWYAENKLPIPKELMEKAGFSA